MSFYLASDLPPLSQLIFYVKMYSPFFSFEQRQLHKIFTHYGDAKIELLRT